MARIKSYKCDRCGNLSEEINFVTVTPIREKSHRRHYCDNCLENLYFHMQPAEHSISRANAKELTRGINYGRGAEALREQ